MNQALAILVDAGLAASIKPDGITLSVKPASRITPQVRQYIIQHKWDILSELQAYQYESPSVGHHIQSAQHEKDPIEGIAINSWLKAYEKYHIDILAVADTFKKMEWRAQQETECLLATIRYSAITSGQHRQSICPYDSTLGKA